MALGQDRSYRLLLLLLAGVRVALGCRETPCASTGGSALFPRHGMMGMGNGAVFQLLPQRFPERVGILTGLVGAGLRLGRLLFAFLLRPAIKQRTGQYSGGLFLFAGLSLRLP